jgi:hypothetical protein
MLASNVLNEGHAKCISLLLDRDCSRDPQISYSVRMTRDHSSAVDSSVMNVCAATCRTCDQATTHTRMYRVGANSTGLGRRPCSSRRSICVCDLITRNNNTSSTAAVARLIELPAWAAAAAAAAVAQLLLPLWRRQWWREGARRYISRE